MELTSRVKFPTLPPNGHCVGSGSDGVGAAVLTSPGVVLELGVGKVEKRVERRVPITGEDVGGMVGVSTGVKDVGADSADDNIGVEKFEELGETLEVVESFQDAMVVLGIIDNGVRLLGTWMEEGVVGGKGMDHDS